jgi:hypothetical protein
VLHLRAASGLALAVASVAAGRVDSGWTLASQAALESPLIAARQRGDVDD